MEFKASAKILENPNVFIGNTGASSNTTASNRGFKNVRPTKSVDDIVNSFRNKMSGKYVGDVTGTFCNKYGEECGNAIIKDTVYSPDAQYKLFSITKRLDQGYKLGGDSNFI